MTHFPLLVVAVVATFSACRCGPVVVTSRPDLRTVDATDNAVAALDYTACPTRDEGGNTVRDVFPDVESVRVTNGGRAPAKAKFTIAGSDADAFILRVKNAMGVFAMVSVPFEQDIEAGSELEIEVAFSPRKKGAHSATLSIDDQDAETKTDPVLTLTGSGLTEPAQPTIETGVELPDGGFTVCEQGSIFTDCELEFPLTQFDTAITRKVRITNKGCPALKVNSIKVSTDVNGATDSTDFRLVSPAAPSMASPISLNKADGTEAVQATIEFKPTDTGAGNEAKSAFIIVNTNDPANANPTSAPGVLNLRGEGLRPALTATPSSCDFSRQTDLCGNTNRVPNRARFVVRNDGNASVQISEVKFKSSGLPTTGQNGRFTLVSNPTGMTIAQGSQIVLEVTHSEMPVYVIDELTVKGTTNSAGQTVNAGEVSFALFGGLQPCLDTIDEVNFNNPQTAMSAQPFFIRNRRRLPDGGTDSSQCGTLVINQVGIEQNMFFSIVDPKIPPNTQIPAGGMAETGIQYNRPPSGGMQVGKLKVLSNDPFFGPPAGTKEINVISASPFDPPPTAVLKGCIPAQLINDPNCTTGSESQLTVQLSQISQVPKTVTVSGFDSIDFDGATMGKPTEFRFQLAMPHPQGANAMSISPNVRGPADKAVLTLPGTGLYRVNMTVWDARGQQGQPVALNINVVP